MENSEFENRTKQCGINVRHSAPFLPQVNEEVERKTEGNLEGQKLHTQKNKIGGTNC